MIVKSEPSIYIACKSKEAEDLLDFFGLPNMNLNALNVCHGNINSGQPPCRFHKRGDYKCSFNIVKDLKHFMKHG